ncbi:hypothetical protein [Deinococcus cellulosilyticus]|uniref:Calcineurin-like phosphoesterase domain-containing protein n=1 Tax=Deinococcus cellulosilyticus (strain DSM 18568 / NBRC 106333 / KACC 11606 / 5516J-15) TaxID=1223518 RepID=A0A511N8R4_DEIC1|nr:hypothetical protein [Deinococcus cellulosilyticus]GEM48927.1 hypothetical protein DC3_45620 [Deinococcus cellulosilyticus NBRC 106333 = KACC 11606]
MKTPLITLSILAFSSAFAARHSFIAIGDMPYGGKPEDYAKFQRLIDRINQIQPAFTVHIGDIKSGSTPCTDEELLKVKGMLNSISPVLVYTPGDNEWTDCHREKAGKYNPLERLEFLRKNYFQNGMSLGKTPVKLESQSENTAFAKFVENTRWDRDGIQYATLHVIGSDNNLQRNLEAAQEYFERNAANLAWLKGTFQKATSTGAKAVVLFMQADMINTVSPGFADTLATLKSEAAAFKKPVLLVHGDSHIFIIDRPFNTDADNSVPHLTRLEVPGDGRVYGIQVNVDTEDASVFSFKPVVVPENQ